MQLVRYEAARQALQAAHSVDEVKDIRDKAQAMAAYARQAKDTALVEWATEIKVRAERKAGEILKETAESGERATRARGGANIGAVSHDETPLPTTLDELGISRSQSSRWQKLAAIPEDKFEIAVAAAKDVAREVTTAGLLRLAGNHRAQGTGENEWYTPPEFAALARSVMGGIDLDPASETSANEVIKASKFFTKDDDGLTKEWHGRVWLNPPYSRDLMPSFVDKLISEYGVGNVSQAILVSHNVTETNWFQKLGRVSSAICFPSTRIKFYRGESVSSPVNGQAFFYVGDGRQKFFDVFSPVGLVVSPL